MKPKKFEALNLRQPAGCTILELQSMAKNGQLNQPETGPAIADLTEFNQNSPEEELENYKECFMYFDKRGDGFLRREDLGMALRASGLVLTNQEVKDLCNKYDPDCSGYLDLKAYLCCIAEFGEKKRDSEEEIRKAFAIFDKNQEGVISVKEFAHVLNRIGDALSEEEINSVLGALNTHNDGLIRMDDIVKILGNTKSSKML